MYPPSEADKKFWSLFGYKQNFNGLGVFFSNHDSKQLLSPSISAIVNNGTNYVKLRDDVPSKDTFFFKYRNSHDYVRFKLSAGPNGILAQVQYSETSSWLDCFMLKNVKLRANGYIGFSGFTGPAEVDAFVAGSPTGTSNKKGDRVTISRLTVYNLDLTAPIAQEVVSPTDIDAKAAKVEVEKLFNDNDDTPLDIKQLHELTQLLYSHIDAQTPREHQVFSQLNHLQNQVHRMIQEVKELTLEVRSVQHQKSGHHDAFHSMKSEVMGLRHLFSRQSEQQQQTVEALNKRVESVKVSFGLSGSGGDGGNVKISEVDKLSLTTDSLEDTIRSQALVSSYIVFIVVVMVLGFGLFMWQRMQAIEKKHCF